MTENNSEKITREKILDREWQEILRKSQLQIIIKGFKETQAKIQQVKKQKENNLEKDKSN
jgi:hypothetical protein